MAVAVAVAAGRQAGRPIAPRRPWVGSSRAVSTADQSPPSRRPSWRRPSPRFSGGRWAVQPRAAPPWPFSLLCCPSPTRASSPPPAASERAIVSAQRFSGKLSAGSDNCLSGATVIAIGCTLDFCCSLTGARRPTWPQRTWQKPSALAAATYGYAAIRTVCRHTDSAATYSLMGFLHLHFFALLADPVRLAAPGVELRKLGAEGSGE